MGFDFTDKIDKRCGTLNNQTALSIFSGSAVSILMLLTIPLNTLVVFVLIKNRNQTRYNSLFYKLLLNIAIADLLTGLVADPGTVNFYVKEALRLKPSESEIYLVHLSTFFTDAVALCTQTLLSIDRIIAIVSPIKHFHGMRQITGCLLVISNWIFGACIVLPYFKIGYIRQFFLFCITNITMTFASLIVIIVMYRIKLKPIAASATVMKYKVNTTLLVDVKLKSGPTTENVNFRDLNKSSKSETDENDVALDDSNIGKAVSLVSNVGEGQVSSEKLISKKQANNQQKATKAFLVMLCVFVATYLPTAVTMILMNVCTTCNCLAIHIMRDVSSTSILSSSVFRPLSFILTLKNLRKTVFEKLGVKKYKIQNDTKTSGMSRSNKDAESK